MTGALLAMSVAVAAGLGTGSWLLGLGVALGGVLAPVLRRVTEELPWGVLSAAFVIAGLGALWRGVPLETVLLLGLVWLFLQRLMGTGDERVAALVAGLVLVVVGTGTRSVVFLPAMVLWTAALPRALGRDRAALALPVVAVAIPLFFLLPRLSGAQLPFDGGSGLTGFADDVNLGAMDSLLDDPARVFTATFSTPPKEIPYFRGVALDHFDGRRWWTEAPRDRESDATQVLGDLVRLDIALEAHSEGVLFVAGEVYGIDAAGVAVQRDEGGAYHLPGPPRKVDYTVFTSGPFGPGRGDPFVDARPRLDLPAMPDEMRRLFEEQLQGAGTADERMNTLAAWLRSEFSYTREPRDMDVEAPLQHFLLVRREGHCEYFASALAVGGRVVGVPTRLVNGFVGGEAGPDGSIVVRRYHAHSWVEYFDGDRWVTIDGTPAVGAPVGPGFVTEAAERIEAWWESRVVAYDAQTQVAAARRVADTLVPFTPEASRGWVGAGLAGLMIGLAVLGVRRLLRRAVTRWEGTASPTDPVSRLLHNELSRLRAAGLAIPRHLPDVACARWVSSRDAELGEPLEELAWLAYEVRFGGLDSRSRLARARVLVGAVRTAA